MINISMPIIWTILIIIFVVVEGLTMGLTAIWFAMGAIFALLSSFLKFKIITQFVIFVIFSGLMLFLTKPFVKKHLKVGDNKTNIDSIIGKKGKIERKITKFDIGQVNIEGHIWSAISYNEEEIDLNEEVEVVSVEGVKLIVKRSE
ncbi:NfeD family protein [Clostridiaceae bacterium HSG29]|nr:NfeD family protein [Clostridiaceae bacterium HSG29]